MMRGPLRAGHGRDGGALSLVKTFVLRPVTRTTSKSHVCILATRRIRSAARILVHVSSFSWSTKSFQSCSLRACADSDTPVPSLGNIVPYRLRLPPHTNHPPSRIPPFPLPLSLIPLPSSRNSSLPSTFSLSLFRSHWRTRFLKSQNTLGHPLHCITQVCYVAPTYKWHTSACAQQ